MESFSTSDLYPVMAAIYNAYVQVDIMQNL
jgi:hypothetical protein